MDTLTIWPGVRGLSFLLAVLAGAVLASFAPVAQAVVLEGTGQAAIRDGDMDAARSEARRAALREVALQYEARIASEETVSNGVVTDSRLTVASRAQARDVQLIQESRHGNLLRVTLRADMTSGSSCGGDAYRLKKKVAVTGFPVMQPEQARYGRLDDAGEMLPQAIQAQLRNSGDFQVLSANDLQLLGDLLNAPTRQAFDNRLSNVTGLARELGAQFVVAGVIRDMALVDASAWNTSMAGRLKRGLGVVNQNRRFVADMIVYDGFSGTPVYQKRFQTEAVWDESIGGSTGFGSAGFQQTSYGRAVSGVITAMAKAVDEALTCQPFMTRITRVDGEKVTLSSGASAGLRPGDELHLYRSYSYFDSKGATPELSDSKSTVTLDSVHPEFSNGWMGAPGAQVNIQRDDIAIVW
ncbi:MAG: flagella assembly protein FlgT [Oleiphilaceae bacterium]|nr:flagella assembly protein FlgT [Oleiphilaceae bacterium]